MLTRPTSRTGTALVALVTAEGAPLEQLVIAAALIVVLWLGNGRQNRAVAGFRLERGRPSRAVFHQSRPFVCLVLGHFTS